MPRFKIGILLPTREVVIHGFETSRVIEMAESIEAAGYDSVWVGDSVLTKPRLEPLSTLAAIAMRTKRVKLGTAVYLPSLRNPITIAHALATLDLLDRGRTLWGVGIGGGRYTRELFEKEFNSVGVSFNSRVRRMEEIIEIVRKLETDDSVSYNGRYYKLDKVGMPLKPAQKPSVPIWIACSVAESGLRRVARLADGWIVNIVNAGELAQSHRKVLEFAREYGRDGAQIEPCNYLYMNVDSNRDKSYEEAKAFLTKYYNTTFTPEILERWGSFGNSGDIVKRLEEVQKAGVRSAIVHFASLDPVGKLAIFTRDVLPSFN
ncbi:MAG TPA: LLM class flavin-dependent oxidoreductase [Nitrososphaerales archaeon]|nr:LLM class flavin-dependent oxidoreductase [Nitrososphaerales archaeon]